MRTLAQSWWRWITTQANSLESWRFSTLIRITNLIPLSLSRPCRAKIPLQEFQGQFVSSRSQASSSKSLTWDRKFATQINPGSVESWRQRRSSMALTRKRAQRTPSSPKRSPIETLMRMGLAMHLALRRLLRKRCYHSQGHWLQSQKLPMSTLLRLQRDHKVNLKKMGWRILILTRSTATWQRTTWINSNESFHWLSAMKITFHRMTEWLTH